MNPTSGRQIARAYALSIIIWGALSLITGWEYRIFDQQLNIHSTLLDMVLLAESRGFAYALLTPPIFYLVRRYSSRNQHLSWKLTAYAIGLVPFMLLYSCIRWIVLPPWDATLQKYVPRTAHGPLELIYSGFADQITMYLAIVVAAHAYKYFERVRKQEVEKYEFQRALAASELQALKMQLHPHFLFNTLHGISTLIDTDGNKAKAMVLKLSELLRTTLERGNADMIPLHEEMKFIREYLDLEKMRFGPRLQVECHVDRDTSEILVPQLILQPLVENAIRHGIACSREGGWVEITARKNPRGLEICVRNSIGSQKPPGTGVGLRNTEARLKCLYADDASFSFAVAADRTASATVVLPALSSHEVLEELSAPVPLDNSEENHARADRG